MQNTSRESHLISPSSLPRMVLPDHHHPASATPRCVTPAVHRRRKEVTSWRVVGSSILAGSCGGVASTIIVYPADFLRTKLQNASSGVSTTSTTVSHGRAAVNPATTGGPWQVFRHTIQTGGFRALYTGLAMPLAAQAIFKATVFAVNNVTAEFILDYKYVQNLKLGRLDQAEHAKLSYMDRFICGVMGGAVNGAIFVTPVEFVRNQLISHNQQFNNSSWQVIRYTALSQPTGIRGLWRGTSWTIARDGIGCGFFFYGIAWTQDALMELRGESRPSLMTSLVSGAVGGLAYWVSSLPLDTIKTWVQSSSFEDWNHRQYSNTLSNGTLRTTTPAQVLQNIYADGGARAVCGRLLSGWQVAYGRGIPSAAITIAVYSWVYGQVAGQDAP